MTAGGSAEDSEFVLEADDIDVADVEEIRGPQIRKNILFFHFEANHVRVLVAALNIVDRNREALALRVRVCYGCEQVGRKRSDAALTWQVVTDKSNFANRRRFAHEAFCLRWLNRGNAARVNSLQPHRV